MSEPIGTWGGKNAGKRAAGITSKTACDTCVDAAKMLSTGKKFYCLTCKTMETVTAVTGLEQFVEHADYDCKMSCGCQRIISISVQRSEAALEKLSESKERAAKFRAEHSGEEEIPEIDHQEVERQSLRADMRANDLL